MGNRQKTASKSRKLVLHTTSRYTQVYLRRTILEIKDKLYFY